MHANRNSLPTAAPVTTAALGYINMLPAGLLVVFIYGCTTAVAMSIDEIYFEVYVFTPSCCCMYRCSRPAVLPLLPL